MRRTLARSLVMMLGIALVWSAASLAVAAQGVATADAKTWVGDWNLTIQGGRGAQERTLTIKDASGKLAASLGGGRGGAIEITDVTKKGNDLVLKFKQQGRRGEADVTMTLAMEADGTLKVTQDTNGNATTGTGKKKS